MNGFTEILDRVYEMTAISNIIEEPSFLVMYLIAFVLLYLGIVKKYEPLLLIPIAFGVLIALYMVLAMLYTLVLFPNFGM